MATLGGELIWNKPEVSAEWSKLPGDLVVSELPRNLSGKILKHALRGEVRA